MNTHAETQTCSTTTLMPCCRTLRATWSRPPSGRPGSLCVRPGNGRPRSRRSSARRLGPKGHHRIWLRPRPRWSPSGTGSSPDRQAPAPAGTRSPRAPPCWRGPRPRRAPCSPGRAAATASAAGPSGSGARCARRRRPARPPPSPRPASAATSRGGRRARHPPGRARGRPLRPGACRATRSSARNSGRATAHHANAVSDSCAYRSMMTLLGPAVVAFSHARRGQFISASSLSRQVQRSLTIGATPGWPMPFARMPPTRSSPA